MSTKHTHTTACPDYKAAMEDRKKHEAAAKQREVRQQALAHNTWFNWFRAKPS